MDSEPDLATRIDAILPQTQCTKCGYPGCRPYADAIATGEAEINQCPPGGEQGIRKLAALLERPFTPLNPKNGIETIRRIAVIEEPACIGCTLCIQVCPVDAIVGAQKTMHTILADRCTGCDLCLPPCPVDCIIMVSLPDESARWTPAHAAAARKNHEDRTRRQKLTTESAMGENPVHTTSKSTKSALVLAAMERARLRRQSEQEP